MPQAQQNQKQLLLLLLLLAGSVAMQNDNSDKQCTPHELTIEFCKAANISHTSMTPQEQRIKKKDLHTFKQLETLNCAPFTDRLICSMMLPYCNNDMGVTVPTCYRFCTLTRDLCKKELKSKGNAFDWPVSLNCEQLPRLSMCIEPPKDVYIKELQRMRPHDTELIEQIRNRMNNGQQPPAVNVWKKPKPKQKEAPAKSRDCTRAELRLGREPTAACVKNCHADLLFSRDDKQFAEIWMLLWSVVSLISTFLAFATFVMDSKRFRYPERPMVWVAGCCMLFSCGHLLRAVLGPGVACGKADGSLTGASSDSANYLITRHAGHWCAVVFLILYFSSLAACMWWMVLTVCWYLCAAKKWAHEALEAKAMLLHSCAWGVPLLLSVVLLVLHRIEGDELTHLCVVDGSKKSNTLVFVIIPMSASLLIGLCFVTCAICSTASVRRNLKGNGNAHVRRLEKLLTKIALFSFLFCLPNVCVLAANIYEYTERERWEASLEKVLATSGCVTASGLVASDACRPQLRPSAALFMLKIFMSLAVGMPSGLIVWFNYKSAVAWQRCCCRLLLRQKRKSLPPVPVSNGVRSLGNANAHLLVSSHSKYPPIPGLATSEV